MSYRKSATKKEINKLTRAVVAESTKNEDKHMCNHIFLKSGSNRNNFNIKNIFKQSFQNVGSVLGYEKKERNSQKSVSY
jgi:hypothetical protein